MPPIDLTNLTAHVIVDRDWRISWIEKTIGFGIEMYTADDDRDPTVVKTITSTGVMVIRNRFTNIILTTYIARVGQASKVYTKATGKPIDTMPRNLWNILHYNNNTSYWRNKVAA